MVALLEARKRGGLVVAVALIGCAAVSVFVVGMNSGNLLERTGSIELLCSDGRCGEGSKLTRQNAVKDLDKWADKAELKDRLDELQTVMERGMTHKSAAKQLDQYFDSLDQQVHSQKMHALRQAQSEGLDMPVLSTHKHKATSLHASQMDESSDDSSEEQAQTDDNTEAAATESHDEHDRTKSAATVAHDEHKAEHARTRAAVNKKDDSSSSADELNKYFDRQAAKIEEENKKQLHSSKLTAAQAEADLDKYFDSIPVDTKKTKMQAVEKKLDVLDKEVMHFGTNSQRA
jgi:hypothetical protein